jgi:hypothetical protein
MAAGRFRVLTYAADSDPCIDSAADHGLTALDALIRAHKATPWSLAAAYSNLDGFSTNGTSTSSDRLH